MSEQNYKSTALHNASKRSLALLNSEYTYLRKTLDLRIDEHTEKNVDLIRQEIKKFSALFLNIPEKSIMADIDLLLEAYPDQDKSIEGIKRQSKSMQNKPSGMILNYLGYFWVSAFKTCLESEFAQNKRARIASPPSYQI